ncbi:hypothetical protein M8J77_018863 [Diaphorina citri]|nr:hypothetical protein M8J77_018863 [Diaphorina citri]
MRWWGSTDKTVSLGHSLEKLQQVFQWRALDFEYPSEEIRQYAKFTKDFVPENNLPVGIEVWRNKLFVTVPRWEDGVPSTLNYIPLDAATSSSPNLIPYPSWEANQVPPQPQDQCDTLTTTYRIKADSCDRLWVLDSGTVGIGNTTKQICPYAIHVFDLKTDRRIRKYQFRPEDILPGTFIANIAVDVGKNCEDTFLYASDELAYGLLSYSWEENTSWRASHGFFFPDPLLVIMSDVKLRLLEAREAHLFAELQVCFDTIAKYNVDKSLKNKLLCKACIVEGNYSEFKDIVHQIQELKMSADPEYVPSFDKLSSYNDLLGCVRLSARRLEATPSTKELPSLPEQPKLPVLDLPYFDGNLQNWTLFYETFNSLIHASKVLSNEQKIHYLVSRLKGSALSVCAGIPAVGSNYDIIWKSLVERYEDKRSLAGAYIEQILNFKPIKAESRALYQSFIDQVGASVVALKALSIPDLAEFLLYCITAKKLDAEICKQFEKSMLDNNDKMPMFTDLLTFVKNQVRVMERTESSHTRDLMKKPMHPMYGNSSKMKPSDKMISLVSSKESKSTCPACKTDNHPLYRCPVFGSLEPRQRLDFVKAHKLCFNCLSDNHHAQACPSKSGCRTCGYKHNTMLHLQEYSHSHGAVSSPQPKSTASRDSPPPLHQQAACTETSPVSAQTMCASESSQSLDRQNTTVLLSTVKVAVQNNSGDTVLLRMLLDSASMSHFLTSACCKKLGIKYQPLLVEVRGIGGIHSEAKGVTELNFRSRYDPSVTYKLSDVLVVDKITSALPLCQVDTRQIPQLSEATLSDDEFHKPGPIDGLIGAELFSFIIGKRKVQAGLNSNSPVIMESVLGDVILGRVPIISTDNNIQPFSAFVEASPLESIMEKFWTLEEVPVLAQPLSCEEKRCEEMFTDTYQRREDGRYCVSLPFKLNPNLLGNSYDIAKKRFLNLERKLSANSEAKASYSKAITEYISEGYATRIELKDKQELAYYMPHHAVVRPDRATTKVRIVFDLSCKTQSGLSLNEMLYAGPTLYKNLFQLLISFCMFPITCTADIRKMFLQVYVDKEDQKFQRFLWRESPQEPLQCYQMERVVFGMRPSPFLAQRVLRQLAKDYEDEFPSGSHEVSQSFYMDDFLSSFMSKTEAVSTITELVSICDKGGFHLTKFASNNLDILKSIPEEQRMLSEVEWGSNSYLKVLGIQWNPKEDTFSFCVNLSDTKCSKRSILSTVARIFDILGFISPVTLSLKLLIKDLWNLKIDWDEDPPIDIQERWSLIMSEFPALNNLKIPRHLGICKNAKVKLIGFCDASLKALGVCVYVHVTQPDESIHVHLVCAKSKVAPMKFVTIPRLELCSALLLSKLLLVVMDTFKLKYDVEQVYCFTDSTISLCWILSEPYKWNTFVANRVSKIQEIIPPENWHHIAGTDNPADVLSRGTNPNDLLLNRLYWNGPDWLWLPHDQWNVSDKPTEFSSDSVYEERKKTVLHVLQKNDPVNVLLELANRISSWRVLLRSVAFVFKFCRLLPSGPCNVSDIEYAENRLLQALQSFAFKTDYENLKDGKPCSNQLIKLKPFIKDGIIRCGGRLSNASHLSYEHVHPIVLPKNHHIVNLKLGDRYKLIQQLLSSFWKRWSNEYLSSLQERLKWQKNTSVKLEVEMLVIVKSENTPVLSWPLGRIVQLFLGADDVVRVALVRTSNGTYKRPVVKLCPLPSQ